MKVVKSPLRYPGGKSKAIPQISLYTPTDFQEYREPFVGGGSVFIYLKQKQPGLRVWINDLNYDVFCFWQQAQACLPDLVKAVQQFKVAPEQGRAVFQALTTVNLNSLSAFDRAVRFFVLNRITFSGTADCGGFSQAAFEARFTDSSIQRLQAIEPLLADVQITNLNYSVLLEQPGSDVFIFLDPPYLTATASKLYGKKGDLHAAFDHQKFAIALQACPHPWLITYDDSTSIRENFGFAHLYPWQLQYGMNNYRQTNAAKGQELMITSYPVAVEHKSC
ncbi:MAG: DNA adenine methylase [Aphanocapsa sp. GSE-SYN-MK-11-07L]|jgi:DNA adenine methylase|nr:DNA adenine methylase [Aphanocapsa sp. GSE-SYN-MK-11-07L]